MQGLISDIPPEKDPVNELDRQMAVIYCRVNSWKHPLTGKEMTREECEWLRRNIDIMALQAMTTPSTTQKIWMNHELRTNEPASGETDA